MFRVAMNSGELLSCIVPSNFSSCLAQKRIEQKYLQVVGGGSWRGSTARAAVPDCQGLGGFWYRYLSAKCPT